jgi:hypothetical protein
VFRHSVLHGAWLVVLAASLVSPAAAQPVDLDPDGDLDLLGIIPGSTPSPQLVLDNTSRHLTQDAPARPGRPLNMGLHGALGGLWFLYAAAAPASIALPPFGTVFMDSASIIQLGAGSLSTGSGAFSFPLPPSASSLVGITFELQGFLDMAAGPRLTNARHVLMVSYRSRSGALLGVLARQQAPIRLVRLHLDAKSIHFDA